MSTLRMVNGDDAGAGLSGSVLFGTLWASLADLLGSAATAVLVRRAARRALSRSDELYDLTVERLDEEFGYKVPQSFKTSEGPPDALRLLLDELRPLLRDLTGEVALQHLVQVPELRRLVLAAPLPT
jgi:hypothetical protein